MRTVACVETVTLQVCWTIEADDFNLETGEVEFGTGKWIVHLPTGCALTIEQQDALLKPLALMERLPDDQVTPAMRELMDEINAWRYGDETAD